MHKNIGFSYFLRAVLATWASVFAGILLFSSAACAQVSDDTDRNMSQMANYQNECAIIKNPANQLQLFAACNNSTGGLFAARSIDGGLTWVYPDASKTIANGINLALGPAACCDPALAWDTFGNLYITYIDSTVNHIVTLLSMDGGQTFATLASFGPASVDQPTVTADSGEVWIVWNLANQMVARGAAVTGLAEYSRHCGLQLRRHHHRSQRSRGAGMREPGRRARTGEPSRQHQGRWSWRQPVRGRNCGDGDQRRRLRSHTGTEQAND